MGPAPDDAALDRAALHALRWLASVPGRRVPAAGTADHAAARLGTELPQQGRPAAEVVDGLAAAVEPGLMANASGRFFGWVMGSSLPAALAADWLLSAWGQQRGLGRGPPRVGGGGGGGGAL